MQLFLLMGPQEGESYYTNRFLRGARRDISHSTVLLSYLYLPAS